MRDLPEYTQLDHSPEPEPQEEFEEYTQLAAGPGRGWWGPPKGTHGVGTQGKGDLFIPGLVKRLEGIRKRSPANRHDEGYNFGVARAMRQVTQSGSDVQEVKKLRIPDSEVQDEWDERWNAGLEAATRVIRDAATGRGK